MSKSVELLITLGRERPQDIIAKAEQLSQNIAFNPGGILGGGSFTHGSPGDCPGCLPDCDDMTLAEYLGIAGRKFGYVVDIAAINGDVYETAIPAREIDAVWFDDLPALKTIHWNVTELNAIDPVEDLLPGTVVKTRFVPY